MAMRKNSYKMPRSAENPESRIYAGKSTKKGFSKKPSQELKKKSYCHLHNASKEYVWPKKISNFMHGFKSAILAKMKNCHNGTFEPVHEILNFFWPKVFF